MKTILFCCIFFVCMVSNAQSAEEQAVQETIESFFEGFHEQDSVKIKKTIGEEIVLQTIGKNKEGNQMLRTANFDNFLKSIVSIPKSTKFEEKIISYSIQVDGAMANAWTAYEFWVNDGFSHCGVNSFQLFKDGEDWKIIYLVDTRRKENCTN